MLSRLVQFRSSLLQLQCKSISKRWRCTIPYPNLHKNKPADESVFIIAGPHYTMDKKGKISSYTPPWITKDADEYIPFEKPVSNSCNGMMLIRLDNSLFLFNPLTNYFAKVLEFDLGNYFSESHSCRRLGLCYDALTDDYRALVLMKHLSSMDNGKFIIQASLKEKKWTKVDFPFDYSCVEQGPFLNDRLHWISYPDMWENTEQHIICYNPVSNAFEKLPPPLPWRYWEEKEMTGLPPRKPGAEGTITGLGVMQGCLWMTRRIDGVNGVEVLKMEEYGVGESWACMFVISDLKTKRLLWGSLIPLLITEKGGVLFYKSWLEDLHENEVIREVDRFKYNRCGSEILEYDPETNRCQTCFKTSAYEPLAVSFVNNLDDSPVGYHWDPVQHQQFSYFSWYT